MPNAENNIELHDAEIIRRTQSGEQSAYALLIQRHQTRLRTALSFYLSSRDELEERLQDAFVQAYVSLAQFDLHEPFFPWLKSIALNGLKMELRRQETAQRKGGDYLRYIQLSKPDGDSHGVVEEEKSAALKRCLQKILPDEAGLLTGKYVEGYSIAELAERHSTTEGALKVRLLRLRDALRNCIDKTLALAHIGGGGE
ncbi:MAG: RNA polymerase sigma factor [Planctomycetota bacterium]